MLDNINLLYLLNYFEYCLKRIFIIFLPTYFTFPVTQQVYGAKTLLWKLERDNLNLHIGAFSTDCKLSFILPFFNHLNLQYSLINHSQVVEVEIFALATLKSEVVFYHRKYKREAECLLAKSTGIIQADFELGHVLLLSILLRNLTSLLSMS